MAMNLNAFAIADFTEAENLNSKSAVAFINRAICYKIAEKYKEAISDFTSAIRLKPHEDLYDQRAECYCALG
jgi:tetratricopeptide (TPR) repeat protein